MACKLGKMGVTDAGKITSAVAWQVAGALLSAANIAVSSHMANKQFDLARRYYQISRNWRDWYNHGYVPLEEAELAEVAASEPVTPHYDVAVGRVQVLVRLGSAEEPAASVRCMPVYNTGLRTTVVMNAAAALSESLASISAVGWRYERARVRARDDLRWQRMEAAVRRGRSMAAQNVSYGQVAANIFGQLAQQAGNAAAGYFKAIGYIQERHRPLQPPNYRQPPLLEDRIMDLFSRDPDERKLILMGQETQQDIDRYRAARASGG